MITEEKVMEVLKDVYDPELWVNVVDLGLVYGIEVEGDRVYVAMTMAAPGHPMDDWLYQDARDKVMTGTGARDAEVDIVWDPPWTPDRITDDGKKMLGWM